MRTIGVTTPDGATWDVRVVWQPRWRALARRFGGWRRRRKGENGGGGSGLDGLDIPGGSDDLAALVLVIIGLILFGLLFWFLLLPLLLLLVDVVVVILLLALAIPVRVLLRRPWTVEASRRGPDGESTETVSTHVVGWRNALRARDEIADKLRAGYPAQSAVAN